MRILVVDDDPSFRKFTTLALKAAGFEFAVAENGAQGLEVLARTDARPFDAILLDIEMPEASGLELLETIRTNGSETPVLFVTGRTELPDRVHGLQLGADDYITKPVEYAELIARIEAVVRRNQRLPTLEFGVLTFDLAMRRVRHRDRRVDLSPREYDLLLTIVQADGEPVSRAELLKKVWNLEFDPETNVIDVHIGRVRKKLNRLGLPIIETVRGAGYRALLRDA